MFLGPDCGGAGQRSLADPGSREALYDIQSMPGDAGLETGCDQIRDETMILNFCHLPERYELTKVIFTTVSESIRRPIATGLRRRFVLA